MNPSVLFVFILSILLGVLRAADLAFGTDAVTSLCVVGSVWWRYLALGIVVLAAVLVGRTQPSRSEAVRSRSAPRGAAPGAAAGSAPTSGKSPLAGCIWPWRAVCCSTGTFCCALWRTAPAGTA